MLHRNRRFANSIHTRSARAARTNSGRGSFLGLTSRERSQYFWLSKMAGTQRASIKELQNHLKRLGKKRGKDLRPKMLRQEIESAKTNLRRTVKAMAAIKGTAKQS